MKNKSRGPDEATADMIDEALSTNVPALETVTAFNMPEDMRSHPELAYGERAEAQGPLHAAEGEEKARKATKKAAEAEFEATVDKAITETEAELAKQAAEDAKTAEAELRPLTRRGKWDSLLYYVGFVLLVVGDSTGISQPLISYGEVVFLAVVQSLSAAVAMVISGFAGRACKDHVNAKHRAYAFPDGLPENLQKYATRFRGGDVTKAPWLPVAASAAVGVIPVGIGMIRYAVNGELWGLAFAAIATGVMFASGVAAYWYTDDIADVLEGYHKYYERALARWSRAGGSRAISAHRASTAEAASIKEEHRLRGIGSAHEVRALPHLIHMNNGPVYGHGRMTQARMRSLPVAPAIAHPNGGDEPSGQTVVLP